jgi:hypothetical protein
MPEHVGAVAREIVLEDENVHELRIRRLHQYEPRRGNGKVKQDAGDPERGRNELPVAMKKGKADDDESGKPGATGPFANVARAMKT